MKPLVVGRPGWDLWMIYDARKKGYQVIDLSMVYKVYHQNHDYSHKKKIFTSNLEEPESKWNLSFLPENLKFTFTLEACDYYVNENFNLTKSSFKGGNIKRDQIDALIKNINQADIKNCVVEKVKVKGLAFIKRMTPVMTRRIPYRLFWLLFISSKRKINVGAGGTAASGWISTDIDDLNITYIKDWKRVLLYLRLDNIMAEHVWEHLSDEDTLLANQNCFNFLKKNGVMRLAVPDGYHPDKEYIEYVRPGGNGDGADDHKVLYNYKLMTERLEKVGFRVNLLEYWDEYGNFHFTDWTDEAGKIIRSKRYDKRNNNEQLEYTSLIIDAIKL